MIRVVQPLPDNDSLRRVPRSSKITCSLPVRFVKFRFKHHAGPSGYDRICDYVDAPTVPLPKLVYLLGETALRPIALWQSKMGGKWEYSRYDFTMELAVLLDLLKHRSCLYHFVYAEKSFHMTEMFAGKYGHRLVGTVHHSPQNQVKLFKDQSHFRAFDHLIVVDPSSIAYWEQITGKQNVTWIPHGVDTDYFHPIDRPQDAWQPRVVFGGYNDRDFESLTKVVETVISNAPNVRFDLIGRSRSLEDLSFRFSNVVNHKYLLDSSFRQILQKADLLLLPLKTSTYCNLIFEALACGTPVVTNHGGIEAYLDKRCTSLCDVGDIDAMTNAVLGAIQGSATSPAARSAARQNACRYSWSAVSQLHVDFYRRLLSQ